MKNNWEQNLLIYCSFCARVVSHIFFFSYDNYFSSEEATINFPIKKSLKLHSLPRFRNFTLIHIFQHIHRNFCIKLSFSALALLLFHYKFTQMSVGRHQNHEVIIHCRKFHFAEQRRLGLTSVIIILKMKTMTNENFFLLGARRPTLTAITCDNRERTAL